MIKEIRSLAINYKAAIFKVFFLALVYGISTVIQPILLRRIIDKDILLFQSEKLLNDIIIYFIILVAQFIFGRLYYFHANKLSIDFLQEIKSLFYGTLLKKKVSYYDNISTGELVNLNISEFERINNFITEGLIDLFAESIKFIFLFLCLIYLHPSLSFYLFILISLFVVFLLFLNYKIRSLTKLGLIVWEELVTCTHEFLIGIKVINIQNAFKNTFLIFKYYNNKHKNTNIELEKYFSYYFSSFEIFLALSNIIILCLGSNMVLKDSSGVSFGTIISFLVFFNLLIGPLVTVLFKINILQMGWISIKKVLKVCKNEFNDFEEYNSNYEIIKNEDSNFAVVFDDVWLKYNTTTFVLKGITFKIKKGESLGIIGISGSGKSSIANLLNRFYEPDKGIIQINGTDINKYDLQKLRSMIGYVFQDHFLFSGSLRDNLTLFNNQITDTDILLIAKKIDCIDLIYSLPGGLNFKVSERGDNLSVGQRNLFCIIRCLLYDHQIIVFDEPSSSLDTVIEDKIFKAIRLLMIDRTFIIIAHRLNTVKELNNILVLNGGEILEYGSHEVLIRKNGKYKSLLLQN